MKPILLYALISFPLFLYSQIEEPDRTNIRPVVAGYYTNPQFTNFGIFLTDEKSQNLYILRDRDTIPELFINYPADYKNYVISADENNIAFKKYENGICSILNFNIKSQKQKKVFTTKEYCSNISFTSKNHMVFSSNNLIYIISGKDTLKNQQDDKIIELSISPDGNKLVIQTKKGKTRVVETKTFKTIDNLPSYSNSYKWSPDSKRLAFQKDFEIHVWDYDSKSDNSLGEGTSFNWSPNSQFLIFQKNTPIELKFVNADIYISNIDTKEIYQITSTINRFETQPIFISENEILFLTYEDRQIIRAGLSNFKLENEKVLYKVSK